MQGLDFYNSVFEHSLSKSDLDFLESAISRSAKISLPNFLKGSRTEEVNAA